MVVFDPGWIPVIQQSLRRRFPVLGSDGKIPSAYLPPDTELFDTELVELLTDPSTTQAAFDAYVTANGFHPANLVWAGSHGLALVAGNSVALNTLVEPPGVLFLPALANSSTAMNAIAGSTVAMNILAGSSTAMGVLVNSSTAMTAIAASSVAMNIIAASSTLMNLVVGSPVAMTAIAASSVAMGIIAGSSTLMNLVVGSPVAMTAIAASSVAMGIIAGSSTLMNLVVGSSTAMNAIAASSTAMGIIAGSSTAMNAIAGSSTAMNAIARSSTALAGVFSTLIGRNAVWMSQTASDILLGNATALNWMEANVSITSVVSLAPGTWNTSIFQGASKIFLLKTYTSSGHQVVRYQRDGSQTGVFTHTTWTSVPLALGRNQWDSGSFLAGMYSYYGGTGGAIFVNMGAI